MATIEERLSAIEATIAAIPQRGKWVSAAEGDLREAALQFARAKAHGMYVEGKERIMMSKPDADDMAERFVRKMKSAALLLLQELGMEEGP